MVPRLVLLLLIVTESLAFLEKSNTRGKLDLTSSITQLEDIGNKPLVLTCTFKPSENPHVSQLLSLKLSRRSRKDTGDTELVKLSPTNLHDTEDFNSGTATGHVRNDGSDSFLRADFREPTDAERAYYICHAVGLDDSGFVLAIEASVRVGIINFEEVYSCMRNPHRPSMTLAKESLLECQATEDNWFEMLKNATERFAKEYSNDYGVSDIFESKSFYVFTGRIKNFAHGEERCRDFNAYVAEINTEQEFLFLEQSWKILKQIVSFKDPPAFLVTGASYLSSGGPWRFRTHPDAPIYLGHWRKGEEPRRDSMRYNSLLLKIVETGFFMMNGYDSGYDSGFLCEVSKEGV